MNIFRTQLLCIIFNSMFVLLMSSIYFYIFQPYIFNFCDICTTVFGFILDYAYVFTHTLHLANVCSLISCLYPPHTSASYRSSQAAGGMQSARSVHTVAAALTVLFLRAAMTRATASVAAVLWVDTVTCVAVVTRGERPRGLWSVFQLKPCSRDGVGHPAQGGVPVGRTGPQQG